MHLPGLPELLAAVYGTAPEQAQGVTLAKHASSRSYHRITVPGAEPTSLVVMELPAGLATSDELPQQALDKEQLPFLQVQRLLEERRLPVPRVLADHSGESGLIALEDLGDVTLEKAIVEGTNPESIYNAAVDLLVRFQEATDHTPQGGHLAYSRGFDAQLLFDELEHFREWGLEAPYGPLAPEDREALQRDFRGWAAYLAALPRRLVHRDFQSRNLMAHEGRLVLIDFQDALLGPEGYDLAALLFDSYVDNSPERQRALVDRFVAGRGLDGDAFLPRFWLTALQRKLKDAGRFVFIDRKRNNSDFLEHFPQSIRYVDRLLEQLQSVELGNEPAFQGQFAALRARLRSTIPGYPDQVEAPPSEGSR